MILDINHYKYFFLDVTLEDIKPQPTYIKNHQPYYCKRKNENSFQYNDVEI